MTRAPREAPTGVRPFSSGSEGYDWMSANCNRCTKEGAPDAMGDGPCRMETAVARGFILGTIPADIATELGATVRGKFCTMPRQCPQFVSRMGCESIKTRNRRPCGKPATGTVENNGLQRSVCDRHRAAFLESETRSADQRQLESPSPTPPSDEQPNALQDNTHTHEEN